jgi:hypothetical protein
LRSRHIPPDDEAFRGAEDLFFTEFTPRLAEDTQARLDEVRSQVVSLGDLLLTDWMSSWKLDLDFLTYGGKGAPDSREPHA